MSEKLLKIQIELQCLITDREAMIAENQTRISNDEALAYGEEDFYNLSNEMKKLINKI